MEFVKSEIEKERDGNRVRETNDRIRTNVMAREVLRDREME